MSIKIRHVPAPEGARFQVIRQDTDEAGEQLELPSPVGYRVKGRGAGGLADELRWYLEYFIRFPFPPATDKADHVREALQRWGKEVFTTLFGAGAGQICYQATLDAGEDDRRVLIESADPAVLVWPWEALHDGHRYLALDWPIVRCRTALPEPVTVEGLADNRVNVLLVAPHPADADYAAPWSARSLADELAQASAPVRVHVLRPATIEQLRQHLRGSPGFYHALHIEGALAGSRSEVADEGDDMPLAAELLFEDQDAGAKSVPIVELGELCREHGVPITTLTLRHLANEDDVTPDLLADVGITLLDQGVGTAVIVPLALTGPAPGLFFTRFYQRLFESGDPARASVDGRQRMLDSMGRFCIRGQYDLHDWLVPVVYQAGVQTIPFAASAAASGDSGEHRSLPAPFGLEDAIGCVGREPEFVELERAMRQAHTVVVVHGEAGIGKTSLVRAFVRWLQLSGGLRDGCLWVPFSVVDSADSVFNVLGKALFGDHFLRFPPEQQQQVLRAALIENNFLVVWDGIDNDDEDFRLTNAEGLSHGDQYHLRAFAKSVAGGRSKIIATSRGVEQWLGDTTTLRVEITGFRQEESWEYCYRIVQHLDLGSGIDFPTLFDTVDPLQGNPLAIRALLPALEGSTVVELNESLTGEFPTVDEPRKTEITVVLSLVRQALPLTLVPLLAPLSLYEKVVEIDHLHAIATTVDVDWRREDVERLLAELSRFGLSTDRGDMGYEIHSVWSDFLRNQEREIDEVWSVCFVDQFSQLAQAASELSLSDRQRILDLHTANLRSARRLALACGMTDHYGVLTFAMADHACESRNYSMASTLIVELADSELARNDPGLASESYHRLGNVAHECRDLTRAARWFRRALSIADQHGDDTRAARSTHSLGIVAQEKRDLDAAADWYQKSLAIESRRGNEQGVAINCHQLGIVARQQRDLTASRRWQEQSLEISERLGVDHFAASSCHQLGWIAAELAEFDDAEQWFRKSLGIKERYGNEHSAITCHELGLLAQRQGDPELAQQWYLQSLDIEGERAEDQGMASSCHQLGLLAEKRDDLDAAEHWHRRSLAISERLNIEHFAAASYDQLGGIATLRGDLDAAENWYRKSLAIKEQLVNEHGAAYTYHQLGRVDAERGNLDAAESWYRKSLAIRTRQNNDRGAALTYGQLAALARSRERYVESAQWLIKSITSFQRQGNHQGVERGIRFIKATSKRVSASERTRIETDWSDAGLGPFPESD